MPIPKIRILDLICDMIYVNICINSLNFSGFVKINMMISASLQIFYKINWHIRPDGVIKRRVKHLIDTEYISITKNYRASGVPGCQNSLPSVRE